MSVQPTTTPTQTKPVVTVRDKYEKLLIAVVAGMIGVAIGGMLVYCFNVIGALVAIMATLLCVLCVPVVLRVTSR
jgi:hypothetical protein